MTIQPLVTDREGVTERGRKVPIGTTVAYRGHVIGGMVLVEFSDGTTDVMHPFCFATLR